MAKNTLKKVACAVGGLAALFFAANTTALLVSCMDTAKKIKLHEHENNLSHSLLFGSDTIEMNADTKNAFVTCLSGSVTLKLDELPESSNIYLDIKAGLGKINLMLPSGVDIWYGGSGHFETIKDSRSSLGAKKVCTLHLYRKTLFSKIVISDM